MNDAPRQKLQWILQQYGRAICDDPRRCEALLRDLCPDAKREVTLLIGALKENVAQELLNHSSSAPIEVLLNRQVQRLYDHLGMAEEFARWAVESWALSLGVITAPLPAQKKPGVSEQPGFSEPPSRIVTPPRPAEFRNFTVDLGQGATLEMIAIPGGTFLMGAPASEKGSSDRERPQHRVTVSPFYLGKYPITQAQWETVMGKNPAKFKGPNRPVERVSWEDCQQFIQAFNTKGQGTFRLPTEAEWEYACRAGTETIWCFGNDEQRLKEFAWYLANSNNQTHPVGQLQPNAWGLYDMHGNVWEFCADSWHDNYQGAPEDGSAWRNLSDKKAKVRRGGSWFFGPRVCRSASRGRLAPDDWCFNCFGGRLAVSRTF